MDLVRIVTPAMWLQDSDSISSGNSHLLMIFVGMVAAALVTQAIALIVMAVGAAKARKHGLEMAEDLKMKLLPLIAEAHSMVRDTSPKLKVITENLVETSHVVRAKAVEFDATMSDANDRARMQIARVDGMVGKTLTTTSELMTTIENAVRVPVREFAGIVNGLKAGLDVLVGKAKHGFGTRQPPEQDRDVI
jgi:hypothetical protein